MKYFTQITPVKLPAEVFQKAKQFANEVAVTTNYSDSNQSYKQKIINDHYVSKLGEEAVKIVMSKYAKVTGPDYTIYLDKSKSWDDDLFVDGKGLAVKTQKRSAANKYGLSWTFQAGAARKDIILQKPDAWISFVEYDDVQSCFCYVYPVFQMKELKFQDPVLDRLKGHKQVVYANTLLL